MTVYLLKWKKKTLRKSNLRQLLFPQAILVPHLCHHYLFGLEILEPQQDLFHLLFLKIIIIKKKVV